MTALEPVSGAFLPIEPGTAKRAMEAYQQLCQAVLTSDDIIGIPGTQGGFVKRSGWSKLQTFYGASTEIIRQDVDRDEDGFPVRVSVITRATATNGRHADGDGACAITEPRFRSSAGRQKAEHDLRATATTRATNRAISNLIGFGAVSAEEAEPSAAEPTHPFGPAADRGLETTVLRALETLGVRSTAAQAVIEDAGGYLPKIAARAFIHAAANRLDKPETVEAEAETIDADSVPDTEDAKTPDPA